MLLNHLMNRLYMILCQLDFHCDEVLARPHFDKQVQFFFKLFFLFFLSPPSHCYSFPPAQMPIRARCEDSFKLEIQRVFFPQRQKINSSSSFYPPLYRQGADDSLSLPPERMQKKSSHSRGACAYILFLLHFNPLIF